MSFEKVKAHLEKHKTVYIAVSTAVSVAGITWLIMRDRSGSIIIRDTIVDAQRDTIVLGSNATLNQVSYFDALRQGPPSWVVRCLETGNVFTSQRAAADAMNIPASRLSQHLNGITDHVNGYHFERICMAA